MAKTEAATVPALSTELLALVQERDAIVAWLESAKVREKEIRDYIIATFFTNPVEGTNRVLTADGFEMYLNYKINRKLDVAALDAVMLELPEDSNARVPGVLIEYKPSLVMTGYKALPADQLKIFQQAIEESPGSHQFEMSRVPTPIMDGYAAAKANPTPAAEPATSNVKAAPARRTKIVAASTARTATKKTATKTSKAKKHK